MSEPPSVDPPNSRLFILCQKNVTEEELRNAFSKYGTIEDIWIVKDKSSGENKGVVYIKYSKASAAALAMEEMNGKSLSPNYKPMKIMIAHSREQGSRKDDDMERLVRLFIVVPKSATDEVIREHFKQFGNLEYVTIVKNRETGESKGFAYVKFHRPYHAALAFEQCDRSYKAMFARPREPKNLMSGPSPFDPVPPMGDRFGYGGSCSSAWLSRGEMGGGSVMGGGGDSKWNDGASVRLTATVPFALREKNIYRLFDLVPGLEVCRLVHERSYNSNTRKVLLQYSSMQWASHAYDKLNGFEYPLGQRITVKMEGPQGDQMDRHNGYRSGGGGYSSGGESLGPGPSGTTTISNQELATLTQALAKAESIIKTHGLGQGPPPDKESHDPMYCSVKLPPPQPLSTNMEPCERLFIVCQPGLPPVYALRDVFGRFGDLVEVYVLNGKNCGYVSYSSKESAEKAIHNLHLAEVCGMRLKVMKAEPPPGGPYKRPKTDST